MRCSQNIPFPFRKVEAIFRSQNAPEKTLFEPTSYFLSLNLFRPKVT